MGKASFVTKVISSLILLIVLFVFYGCGGSGGGGGGGDETTTTTTSTTTTTTSATLPNNPPIADAGIDQDVATGDTVILDAGASSDADNDTLSYNWIFVSRPNGSNAVIEEATTVTPMFIPDISGTYEVQLVVNDGKTESTPDTCIIYVTDLYPLGGTITGLTGTITLLNNETDALIRSINGTYAFSTLMLPGDAYNVTVSQQPDGQICSVINGMGIVTGDITNINIICSADTVKVSLSGTISSATNILSDSDTNDPYATTFASNDTSQTAQSIPNYVTINGFTSSTGTFAIGDNFALIGDEFDIYSVHLNANQLIQLQVVDFAGADTYQGDIDLYLFDSELNLIDFSDSTGELESVISAQEGDYFIVVQAFNGISKYVLRLRVDVSINALPKSSGADFVANEAVVKFNPVYSLQSISSASKNYSISMKHEDTSRATLVNFEPTTNDPLSINLQVENDERLHPFQGELVEKNPESYEKYLTLKNLKALNTREDVEYATPNYIYHPTKAPNDTYYGYQWHYPFINLPRAWDITTGQPGSGEVIVAVIDTGIVLDHPDLQGQFVAGYDFISSPLSSLDGDGIDSNPYDPGDSILSSSSSWHGTHVAGTVAAKTNNNQGLAGVSWNAKLMPIRVLGMGGGTLYDIDQGVRFAAGLPNDSGTVPPKKADIINLSFGGGGFSQSAQQTIINARAAGVIIVAAAGNENISQLSYPASYDGVISVSATDYVGNRAPYSNYGRRIDVAAPGGNISADLNYDGYGDGVLSTYIDQQGNLNYESYNFLQGTSMASPHVAGVLSLMKALYPALTPDEVDILLQNGALTNDAGTIGRDDIYGYGIVDALKSVQAAKQLAEGGDIPSTIIPTPAEISLNTGQNETILNVTKTGSASISINSIIENAAWLSVSPISVDLNGLGQYRVSVNRAGLTGSIYSGSITFNLSQGNPIVIPVTMAVAYQSVGGDAGTLYVLLSYINGAVASIQASSLGNGQFSYAFEDVSPGTYFIIAGSDIDNDNYICQYGESCGVYPSFDYLEYIDVTNQEINNLDFTADILSGLVTTNAAEAGNQVGNITKQKNYRRKVIKNLN